MAACPGLLLVVVHVSKTDAQRHRPPLCSQQFSLANYACANLPFMPLFSAAHSPPSDAPPSSSKVTTTASPPPPSTTETTSPPSPPALPGRRGGRHRHSGHRRHPRVGDDGSGDGDDVPAAGPPASPAEENCCRWLKEMDSECVCDVLVRLPPFLAKPSHVYSVHVYDGCIVTFSCSGRIVP